MRRALNILRLRRVERQIARKQEQLALLRATVEREQRIRAIGEGMATGGAPDGTS